MRIEVIEGIGPAHASALSHAGVTHVRHLIQRAATAGGRETLARETGLSATQLLEWLNHIDLMRIRGVGAEYSDLLEAAGVDSPVELAQHSPARPRDAAGANQCGASARTAGAVREGARGLDLRGAHAAAPRHSLET